MRWAGVSEKDANPRCALPLRHLGGIAQIELEGQRAHPQGTALHGPRRTRTGTGPGAGRTSLATEWIVPGSVGDSCAAACAEPAWPTSGQRTSEDFAATTTLQPARASDRHTCAQPEQSSN
jgi:hypothetical protein